MLSKAADGQAGARASGASWAGKPERGSRVLLAMMIFVSLRLGRPLARCILYGIAAYFFAFAPAARRSARLYLRRALGRKPTARDRFRQVFAFASTILDRLYLVRERYELFAVSIEGEEFMQATLERGRGAFLLGAHLGSFAMMSAIGRQRPGLRVALAMYEHHASRLSALFGTGNPASAPEIIPLGHLETMLRIRDRLDEGRFVGMLADRTIGEAPAQVVSFLGSPALFPSGPMRAAAALRRPVVFMTALYRGGNRYHLVFRPLADFSQIPAGAREAAVREGIERYVAHLEEFCRSDPYNWFNFYDFWQGAEIPPRAHGAGTAALYLLALALASVGALTSLGTSVAAQPPIAGATDTSGAAAFDELLRLFAARRHGQVAFTEVHRLAMLERPLESSGELRYDAPDHLEKRTLAPRPETLILDHGVLTVRRGQHTRVLALRDYPQAVPFVESIRATLAGDRAALERFFRVQFTGDLEHWMLRLVPADATLERTVTDIRIEGARESMRTVEIHQADGDSSVLTLGPEIPP
jgi:predicted LPLAT superfamily acyltransferase